MQKSTTMLCHAELPVKKLIGKPKKILDHFLCNCGPVPTSNINGGYMDTPAKRWRHQLTRLTLYISAWKNFEINEMGKNPSACKFITSLHKNHNGLRVRYLKIPICYSHVKEKNVLADIVWSIKEKCSQQFQ